MLEAFTSMKTVQRWDGVQKGDFLVVIWQSRVNPMNELSVICVTSDEEPCEA